MFPCDKRIEEFIKNSNLKFSKKGQIFRKKHGKWVLLKPYSSSTGYDNVYTNLPVHRIIFRVFNKTIDSNKIVNYIDGNKRNNNFSNLENVSFQSNSRHARNFKLNGKINQEIANLIRKNPDNLSKKELAKLYYLHIGSIDRVLNLETWSNKEKKYKKKIDLRTNYELVRLICIDPNYIIKENGDVWTYLCKKGKTVTQTIRKVAHIKGPYIAIRYKNRLLKLHRVVFLKFKGEILKKNVVNHIDGNKLNNHINNLEQVTYSQNSFHSSRILKNGVVKITFEIASTIRFIYDNTQDFSFRQVAEKYNIHYQYVWCILYNKRWVDPNYVYKSKKKR